MPDIKNIIIKKTKKRKRHSLIINVLKEFMRATTIISYILDLGINLIISKLLNSALAIKKKPTKLIFEYKAI